MVLVSSAAFAQTAPAPIRKPAEPFAITDNSFLVEEAFNQEAGRLSEHRRRGVREQLLGVQLHAGMAGRVAGASVFLYTLSALDNGVGSGIGDTLLNYRYQALTEGPGRPAFSPRASLIIPTGDAFRLRGSGSPGLQVNLPFSKQTGDWYWHWNGGFTWLPRAEALATDPARRSPGRSVLAIAGGKRNLSGAADVQPDARERAALQRALGRFQRGLA